MTWSQFHQHFTCAFFVQIFGKEISNPKHRFVIFGAKILYKKCTRRTLMKLTPDFGHVFLETKVIGKKGKMEIEANHVS